MKKIPDTAKKVFEGVTFDIYQWQQEMLDGSFKTFELAKRPGIACVIPIKDGRIVVNKEKQPFVGSYLTLPSGYSESQDEDLLVSAKRELLEETGLGSSDWVLFEERVMPGRLVAVDHVYVAHDCKKEKEIDPDRGGEEILEVFELSFDEFIALGENPDFRTYFIKDHLKRALTDSNYKEELRKKIFGQYMENNQWEIVYRGDLIAIEKHKDKGFERAVRPPGVRLILENNQGKILLTKEFRREHGGFDLRLPGGKVFDTLSEYLEVRGNKEQLKKDVFVAAQRESKEEAGVDEIKNLSLFYTSVAGASVEWDLYYVTGEISSLGAQELSGDEVVHGIEIAFYTKQEVQELISSGALNEDRSIVALAKYIHTHEK